MAYATPHSVQDVKKIMKVVAVEPDQKHDNDKFYHASTRYQSMVHLLSTRFKTKRIQDLGMFDGLPMEVIIQILLDVDLKTYLALRQTNRAMRVLLTQLSEYKMLTTVAFNVFDAVFDAGIASHVTLRQLHGLLCEHNCMICSTKESSDGLRFFDSRAPKSKPKIAKGVNAVDVYRRSLYNKLDADDGKKRKRSDTGTGNSSKKQKIDPLLEGLAKTASITRSTATILAKEADEVKEDQPSAGRYLFLPTMTRCCKPCLEESPRLATPAVCRLAMAADMKESDFSDVVCKPLFKGLDRKKHAPTRQRLGTVPQTAALGILLNADFPPSRAKEVLVASGYMAEFAWVDDLDLRSRFVMPLPFLGPKGKEVSNGYTCKGCIDSMDELYKGLLVKPTYYTRTYSTKQAFMKHFMHCPDANKMWNERNKK